jgi:hypothetical protein
MAIVATLVWKQLDTGHSQTDTVVAVVIAINDAVDTTDALIRAKARTICNAALADDGAGLELPVGYFDHNQLMTVYDAEDDITVLAGDIRFEFIAA